MSSPDASTAGNEENRPSLSVDTLNVSACPASSAGPEEIAVAQPDTDCGPASSRTVSSPPAAKLGTSFTAVTLIANVCAGDVSTPPLSVPPSSCSSTVIVAEPFASSAGVYVNSPEGLTEGPAENKPALVLPVTLNVNP